MTKRLASPLSLSRPSFLADPHYFSPDILSITLIRPLAVSQPILDLPLLLRFSNPFLPPTAYDTPPSRC